MKTNTQALTRRKGFMMAFSVFSYPCRNSTEGRKSYSLFGVLKLL